MLKYAKKKIIHSESAFALPPKPPSPQPTHTQRLRVVQFFFDFGSMSSLSGEIEVA